MKKKRKKNVVLKGNIGGQSAADAEILNLNN
jgi:hypothetical protein